MTITAAGIQFSVTTIRLIADTPTTVTVDNQDAGTQHNFSVSSDASFTTSLFRGDLATGPSVTKNTLPALPAGTYAFHCDVHPTMAGTVIVSDAKDWTAISVTVDSPAAQASVTSPIHVEGHVEGLSTGQVLVQLVEPYVFSTGAGATVALSYALVLLELTSGGARFSADLPFSIDATTGLQLYVQPIDDTASLTVDFSALLSGAPEQTPPARPEAFLGRRLNANGDPISDADLAVWRGTTTCGGPEMVFLRVNPSPGGIFVRDIAGTLADATWGRSDVLQGLTKIPEPADDTGDHIGSWHLWLPTADAGVVYVVDGSGQVPVIERSPLYISPDPCTANIT